VFDNVTYNTLRFNKKQNFNVIRCKNEVAKTDSKNKLLVKETSNSLVKKKTVLVTLQHGYAGTHKFLCGILPNGIIHDSLIEVVKRRLDLDWIFKAHPAQLASPEWPSILDFLRSEFGGCAHVEFEKYNNKPAADILKKCDLHITMLSGTIVEADLLGVPSIGLCPTLRIGRISGDFFLPQRKSRMLKCCELNTTKILKTINFLLKLKDNKKEQLKKIEKEKHFPDAGRVVYQLLRKRITS
jgi:hypothetical protein